MRSQSSDKSCMLTGTDWSCLSYTDMVEDVSIPISSGSSTPSASWISACSSLVLHCRDRLSLTVVVPVHACSRLGSCHTGTTGWLFW